MSFGRIKRHIKTKHKEINSEDYIKKFYKTLPLHNPCVICNENIVYKYQTCSKKCHSILKSKLLKGKPKPKEFGEKLSRSTKGIKNKGRVHSLESRNKISLNSRGKSRNKGNKNFLGKIHTEESKKIMSEKKKEWYALGNEPWTKNNSHTPETIEKIFKKRKMNKLEEKFSNLLNELNIEYYFQFFINYKGICKSYDFKIKNKNIIIEVDGDYWHGNPQISNHFFNMKEVKQNDILKEELAKKKGYQLIRFWESDIKYNSNNIKNKLKEL